MGSYRVSRQRNKKTGGGGRRRRRRRRRGKKKKGKKKEGKGERKRVLDRWASPICGFSENSLIRDSNYFERQGDSNSCGRKKKNFFVLERMIRHDTFEE